MTAVPSGELIGGPVIMVSEVSIGAAIFTMVGRVLGHDGRLRGGSRRGGRRAAKVCSAHTSHYAQIPN